MPGSEHGALVASPVPQSRGKARLIIIGWVLVVLVVLTAVRTAP